MIGMNSIITKKKLIEPGYIFYGKPVKKVKSNTIGLKKHNITKNKLVNELKRFNKIILK